MLIPESQLKTWSNQGAIERSAITCASIKAAIEAYFWPEGMRPEVYLQGSYPNSTNTRGNNDVDLVDVMSSVFYSNLSEDEKKKTAQNPARRHRRAGVFAGLRQPLEAEFFGSGLWTGHFTLITPTVFGDNYSRYPICSSC